MQAQAGRPCTAFSGTKKIASGDALDVALALRKRLAKDEALTFLVFDDETSAQVEFDLRGTPTEIAGRIVAAAPEDAEKKAGPGRPKLGVISKEVTLLPRHWEWLALQPGGASATLRRLIEDARKVTAGSDAVRRAQDAAYKFMTVMAGNLPEFENALRALYARKKAELVAIMAAWPKDIRDHVLRILGEAL